MKQLIGLSLMMLMVCCKEEVSQRGNLFPVNFGTTWVYNVYDSLEKSSEEVEAKIMETDKKGDMIISQWQYTFNDGTQQVLYAVTSPKKVEFFRDEALSDLERVIMLPLSVGDKWSAPSAMSDVSEVVGKHDIESSGKVFNDTYEVTREVNSFNYILNEDTWIQPGVGIVKMTVKEFNLAPVKNQYWELVTSDIR